MTEPDSEALAGRLRRELADELNSPAWQAAVEAVPRHEIVPRFYVASDAPGPTTYVPIMRELAGVEEWLRRAYSNESLITQFNGREIDWEDPQPISNAAPTSSSTLPGLVVRMLDDLDIDDDQDMTEYGTGTGYSTALLCHRLGAGRVTSVETDPDVAARACAALDRCGYRPQLVVGNGLDGSGRVEPADRTIATMGVRSIPPAWVRETRPGGIVLATLRGWMRSLGLVRLVVEDEHTATGRIVAGDPTFMIARQQTAPDSLGMLPGPEDGEARATPHGPELLNVHDSGFVAQLAMPGARWFSVPDDDGTLNTYVLDAPTESFAVLSPTGDGWLVRQGGPARLWDEVERSLSVWHAAGSPGPSAFGVTVAPERQRVWLGDIDGPSWRLPESEQGTVTP